MSTLAPTNTLEFERWLLANHPDLFDEWELEACEWLELDEWLEREHWEVLNEWWQHKQTAAAVHAGGRAVEDGDDLRDANIFLC